LVLFLSATSHCLLPLSSQNCSQHFSQIS
jgi:hypothetical protein